MDNYYTVVIIICVLTMLSLTVDVGKNTILGKEDIKWFRFSFIVAAIGAICEYFGVLMDKVPNDLHLLHKIITFIEFSISPFLGVCLARSCGMKRTTKPLSIIMLVNVIIQVISLENGGIFYIDSNGIFQRGNEYWIYMVFCGISLAYILFVFVLIGIRTKLHNFLSLIIITMIMITGQTANIIDGNIHSGYLSICITAALFYIFIQNMLRHIMMETINIEKDISNHDPLTKVLSRISYDSVIKKLNHDIQTTPQTLKFAVCECDLNNLKIINDTFGHDAGDEYIISCCKSICDYCKHSPVYRVGGDEFVIIIQNEDYENVEAIKQEMNEFCEKEITKNSTLIEKKSFAAGFAIYDSTKDKNFNSVMKRADIEMYHQKAILKGL
ncbi:MAG: GGDEF domain-containing protein [Treponema sp.]|nr:GGDEF domain-containing protein [Treponema sp.]